MKHYSFYLIGICIAVFILQNIFPWVTNNFALIQSRALTEPWMFLTNIFLHGSVLHLMYNMFALGLFGFILERIVGSKLFLAIFFITGLVASIGSFMFYNASLGASGAIFGILGVLAVLRPRMMIWVYVPMPMILAIFVWAVADFIGLFYPSGVANVAHLAGMASGIIFGLIIREKFAEKKEVRYDIDETKFRQWEDKWMN